jgi:hypothetical protein
MTKTSKTLATIGIVIVFLLFNAMLLAGSGPGGRNGGIIGIVLMFGIIAGIHAVWKKSDDRKQEDPTLDKS